MTALKEGEGVGFRGTYLHTIDQKSRIFMPSSFRDELGKSVNVRLVSGANTYIQCFSESEFDRLFEKYMDKYGEFEDEDILVMKFNAGTFPAVVDAQGRVSLPPEMRERAGISENAYVLGAGRTVSIMSAECYETMFSAYDSTHEQIDAAYAAKKRRSIDKLRSGETE